MKTISSAGGAIHFSRGSGAVLRWVGIPVLTVLLYVLSFGPAIRLSEDGWLAKSAVTTVYWPLGMVRGTPLQRCLNAYVSWWLPKPFQGDLPSQEVR